MPHTCGACDGSGTCQNEFHNIYDGVADVMMGETLVGTCDACGEGASTPGKCSVCGGEGQQDDDSDW